MCAHERGWTGADGCWCLNVLMLVMTAADGGSLSRDGMMD